MNDTFANSRIQRQFYNTLKESVDGVKYTGMRIGGKHTWNYEKGIWKETKIAPDRWIFDYSSNKSRFYNAPEGTGALNNTQYHWFILADQKVIKIDANTYQTLMNGHKFKVAHKRPNWRMWNYEYNNVKYEDIIINFLEQVLRELKLKKHVTSRQI